MDFWILCVFTCYMIVMKYGQPKSLWHLWFFRLRLRIAKFDFLLCIIQLFWWHSNVSYPLQTSFLVFFHNIVPMMSYVLNTQSTTAKRNFVRKTLLDPATSATRPITAKQFHFETSNLDGDRTDNQWKGWHAQMIHFRSHRTCRKGENIAFVFQPQTYFCFTF